jgi:hypothetical protein
MRAARRLQRRQIGLYRLPNDRQLNPLAVVTQPIAHASNVTPLRPGTARFGVGSKADARFADNL